MRAVPLPSFPDPLETATPRQPRQSAGPQRPGVRQALPPINAGMERRIDPLRASRSSVVVERDAMAGRRPSQRLEQLT